MDALAYAVAMAAANAAAATPYGGGDLVHYQGEIVSWDEASAVNAVKVNGAIVSNLRVIRGGIGLAYQPGDTVLIEKRMSQWYILGNVGAPGAGAANQIKSQTVATSQSTNSTSYGDLGTVGPTVTIYIGSSRRCLLLFSANVVSLANAGTPTLIYIGGTAAVQVSGASTLAPGTPYCGGQVWYATASAPTGFQMVSSQVALLTAADGLNQGSNTFTLKYRAIAANPGATFIDRNLTVIPF